MMMAKGARGGAAAAREASVRRQNSVHYDVETVIGDGLRGHPKFTSKLRAKRNFRLCDDVAALLPPRRCPLLEALSLGREVR